MRILIWHVHGSWMTSFVAGPHDYVPAPAAGPRPRRSRPGPDVELAGDGP